ncbi:MAG: class I SAM-dependent methyltransferase [Nitrospirae bacterium]|nr:class I SAM-dependent methyltransferase [Nitrospirota bacterium]MCL5422816.1 class I SAM-dependent methyltransferase [Nitrospirota bacterium]
MDELAREYVISFYDNALKMFGDRPEAVRWTPKGQFSHYLSLLDIGGCIDGKNILDFGCGKGDFLTFLKEKNIKVQYTGVDINEKLIALAKEKNPDSTFRVFDLEKETLEEDFDYIFLCGVFNLRIQGIDETIRNSLKRLFGHCRLGIGFNALSSHNPKKDFELHYVSPEELFTFAVENLSPFVSLRHDRISYDFTLFIYRDANPSS